MKRKCKRKKSFQTGGSLLGFNQYVPTYIGRPVDRIAEMGSSLAKANQQIVDTASSIDLALANEEVLPEDQIVLQEAKDSLKTGISDIASQDNYNLARARLNKLVKDSYLGNQELRRAREENQKYKQYEATLANRIGTGGFTSEDYKTALAISRDNYKGVRGGESFTPFIPSETVDIAELVDKHGSGFMANAIENAGYRIGNDGYIYEGSHKVVNVDPERIRKGLTTVLTRNPELKAYLQDRYTLDTYGKDLDVSLDDYISDAVDDFINYGVEKYSFTQTSDKAADAKGDSAYLSALRAAQEYGETGIGGFSSTSSATVKVESPDYLANKLRPLGSTTAFPNIKSSAESALSFADNIIETITGKESEALKNPTNKYPTLKENEIEITNNLLRKLENNPNLDVSTMTIEEKDKYLPQVADYIDKHYVDFITNASITQLAGEHYRGEDNPKASSSENMTKLVFGNNTSIPEDKTLSGAFRDRYFIDPETLEVFSGSDKEMQNIINDANKGEPVNVIGRYSSKNPFVLITDNTTFSNAYDVQIGNKRLIMSGADSEPVYSPTHKGWVDMSKRNTIVNAIHNAKYVRDGSLTTYIPIGGYSTKVNISYEPPVLETDNFGNQVIVNNGKYIAKFKDKEGNIKIVPDTTEESLAFILINFDKISK